jgi:hypothetical protein
METLPLVSLLRIIDFETLCNLTLECNGSCVDTKFNLPKKIVVTFYDPLENLHISRPLLIYKKLNDLSINSKFYLSYKITNVNIEDAYTISGKKKIDLFTNIILFIDNFLNKNLMNFVFRKCKYILNIFNRVNNTILVHPNIFDSFIFFMSDIYLLFQNWCVNFFLPYLLKLCSKNNNVELKQIQSHLNVDNEAIDHVNMTKDSTLFCDKTAS